MTVRFGVTAPFTDFLRAMNGGWTAGPALSLPIFEGGRLHAQLGAANAGYDQAVERYNQTIVGALKDIADQVVRIRSLDTQRRTPHARWPPTTAATGCRARASAAG
ncbi:RND transporter [Burkholderia diffusa]|uniref:RND transporter n=1 Tax=Burkholderia diffusa TaxID=488732 RepID=A0A6P2QGY4_9BURK|nr:RND transporter [Burkholderia diffusa]